MATSAAWLKFFLAPIEILREGVKQVRDNRLNFSRAFTFSQVPDADGVNMLTVDIASANTSYEAAANTIPIRNGSGTLKGNVITAASYTYSTPITITRDEPIRGQLDPNHSKWDLDGVGQPVSNTITDPYWNIDITPPIGSLLSAVSVIYTPPSGHEDLPAPGVDQPSFILGIIEDDGSFNVVDSIIDDAETLVDYEQKRTLTLTIDPIVVLAGKRYLCAFRSESGPNAIVGLTMHRQARWTVQITSL